MRLHHRNNSRLVRHCAVRSHPVTMSQNHAMHSYKSSETAVNDWFIAIFFLEE
jgi:hypothetical protein